MKTARYSEARIMGILKQAEGGAPVSDLCREHGISSASLYKWRAKSGGMDTCLIAEMEFKADQLADGPSLRTLNVLEDFNRESLAIEGGFSPPAEHVVRSLNQIIAWRGRPKAIRVDNGREHVSGKLPFGTLHHNTLPVGGWNGPRSATCGLNTSSQASHSKTPISNATTARFAAKG